MAEERTNVFRFVLTQGDVLLYEKLMDADIYNPLTRYSINVRTILRKEISKLQRILSRKKYDTLMSISDDLDDIDHSIDLYEYYQDVLYSYPKSKIKSMEYAPVSISKQIENMVIKGVECKLVLYINEYPIIERLFYVDNFNPIARWSIDLLNACNNISDTIEDQIKNSDIINMWDDYDLINKMSLSINQIRELSTVKRNELIRKMA